MSRRHVSHPIGPRLSSSLWREFLQVCLRFDLFATFVGQQGLN